MLTELLQASVLIGILHSGIRLATPYLFAALGETVAQRTGVLDLGVEGIMLMGAISAFYVVFETGNLLLGIIAAIFVGILMGVLMSVISVTYQAEQGISGIGLYLFGLGLSSLLFRVLIGSVVSVTGFQELHIPVLSDIPVIGEIFFNHNLLVYAAYLMVPVIWFLFDKTTLGLKIRSVGQNPQAADSLGVNVNRVRYFGVIFGAAMAGVAGASLSIGTLNVFQENMTNGIGFIAVALVYFGGWRPLGVLLGSLLFATVSALQIWGQVVGINIPSDLMVMLPYVLTIIVLIFSSGQIRQPAALNKPFERSG
ncbi:MAG: ABC transporter permease [Caldilineae bacterium]|nr:ABC transporter permease [Anaerolineae bacterium]MCB0205986.1 ABC transporter permease [Anaerolineae bacterium]MCB0252758.1 ABC transporter permease [Anaerolineae bacterium]MCB9153222.1 ABC transporter permease [Caldilineae bacterium]